MDWTDKACQWGSRERMRVVELLHQSGLVEDMVRRLFPNPGQAERMTEYTMPRVCEKILGRPIVSREAQWNHGNIWSPREMLAHDYSFCGWARRTAEAIAKANPKRILHERTVNASAFDSDDGEDSFNRVFDTREADIEPPQLFVEHPRLIVPRPVGMPRRTLLEHAERESPRDMMMRLDAAGYWHASLDELDPAIAVTLLLAPLKPSDLPFMPRLLPDMKSLAELYAPTQAYARSDPDRERRLRRAVTVQARESGMCEWGVWCALGTAAARLVAG